MMGIKNVIEAARIKAIYRKNSINLSNICNSIENVERMEKIWSKRTSPIFRDDFLTDKRFYKAKDWIAGTFETTWYIKEWCNYEVDDSKENYESFRDTLLQKGSSDELYRIFLMSDNLITCSKEPYRSYNGLIEIPMNKEALEHLNENNINEFKSVYRRK
jgi:hypothetical protein